MTFHLQISHCPVQQRVSSMRYLASPFCCIFLLFSSIWFTLSKPSEPNELHEIPGSRVESSINGVTFAFRWCPPGKFEMGSSEDAKKEYAERFVPQRDVRLSNGFWMQETEVTQIQYEKVMGTRPSFWQWRTKMHHPVEQVSWHDAVAFCERLSEVDADHDYRLPTEAEWEYACRGGTTTVRYGDINEIAWVFQNTDEGEGSSGHRRVGTLKPNPWGIHDMFGNVAEWCSDWHAPPPSSESLDPKGPKTGERRVVRGDDCFADCSSAFPGCLAGAREGWSPSERRRTIGFRVVQIPASD